MRTPRRGDGGPDQALRRALGLLARREHSRAELLAKLARSGHERAVAQGAVENLARQGLVCDARFAEAFIRSRIERGSGPLRIRRDLEARGVEPEVVDRFLDAQDEEWEGRARSARTKRFGAAPPGNRGEAARQSRFLLGRGFTRRQVRRAIEESGWV
ncbi:MAG: regulatory protein RecX [Immundisolibacterales bacterium]|nr:regulatory protein RecX [Immundisolibacterales bacterium]